MRLSAMFSPSRKTRPRHGRPGAVKVLLAPDAELRADAHRARIDPRLRIVRPCLAEVQAGFPVQAQEPQHAALGQGHKNESIFAGDDTAEVDLARDETQGGCP